MYIHTTCKQEITARNIVHEFAPLISFEKEGYIELGEVTESSIIDTELWCEECSETVDQSAIQKAEKAEETGLDRLKAMALEEEEHADDCTDPTDPGTHCENCGACYSRSDVDGGRCMACGKMVCGFEAGSPREAELRQRLVDRVRREYGGDPTVHCKFCHEPTPAATAHLHDGGWVGDECCWDSRLHATE